VIRPSELMVKYDDGPYRPIEGVKFMRFFYENGLNFSIEGWNTIDGIENAIWHGEDRDGNNYVVGSDTAVVVRQNCANAFTAGRVKFKTSSLIGNVTLGVSSDGLPSGYPATGNSYYYKAEWQDTADSSTHEAVIPYSF
jgi:hypothetical protein